MHQIPFKIVISGWSFKLVYNILEPRWDLAMYFKDVNIVVPFAYLVSSYSNFELTEGGGTGWHKKVER